MNLYVSTKLDTLRFRRLCHRLDVALDRLTRARQNNARAAVMLSLICVPLVWLLALFG